MHFRKYLVVAVLLPLLPAVADAQAVQWFGGLGGGVTSVPRGGDSGCGTIAQRMTGFSGELRGGLRVQRLEVAARATRILPATHSAIADCFVPTSGLHTVYDYEDLGDGATGFDVSAWYALGPVLLGAELGTIPDHSTYAGLGAAVGALRRRARIEVTGRLHRVPYVQSVYEYADSRVIRTVSRTDEIDVQPGFAARVVIVWP